MGYTKTAAKGVSWITVMRILTRGITFVRLAILGRLLSPVQFGFFGIASLILSLFEIITETGINVFLVQEKGSLKEYINAAWIVSMIRGVFLSLLIVVLAPYIALFFNAPESYFIILLTAVVPFIRGFINPAIILYQKELFFQKEFKLRSFLFFIDVIVSVIFGFILRDATAFVFGLIASALCEVTLSYILFSMRPTFEFDYKKIRHIIKKGGWVTLTGIFSYFADNGDNLTIGKLLGSSSLGIYQVAYKFSTLPISEITNVVNQVVFPVYSRFSDDKDRLWKAFLKVMVLSSLGATILGSVIFIFAEPIILVFMGDQWASAVPVIKVLAIYGILRTIFGNFAPLFLSVKKQNYVAQMTFVRVTALLLSIVPLVLTYGMLGAGYAMLFSIIFEIPVIIYFAYLIFRKKRVL